MKYAKKGGAKRPYKKRSVKPRKSTKGVSASVKKYVTKAIHRNVENKKYVVTSINQTLGTASGLTPTNVNLIPDSISQGAGHSQRIGNEIKCVKGIIKGYVNYLPYNIATNPQSSPLWIKMFLVSSKKINTNLLSATSVNGDFFDLGGFTGTFAGTMRDLLTPVNNDTWTVLASKQAKIGFSNGNTGGTPVSNATWFDNSPFTIPFTFNYGKHLKTVLKYNDGISTVTNRNMFLILQAVYADGTNTAISAAEYHYSNVFEYEDA